ncbi:MAG: Crp/Fnr family transcriptional regulator [Lachnospiraceae bacterium]|nr:Crp/Fnr family transcriptional regulator [Lachnospiraceae bacterium]
MKRCNVCNQIVETLSSYYHMDLSGDVKDIEDLVSKAQYKCYKKGELLLTAGDSYENIGYVLSGVVRSYYVDKTGNDITKYFHVENQLFMDEGLFDYNVSICTYEALEDCEILILKTQVFKEAVWKSDCLKDMYLFALQEGMKYKIYRENSFLTQSAAERYRQFCSMRPELEGRVKQAHIATYLGIAPESLSRIKRGMKEES